MLKSSLLLFILSFPVYGEWYIDLEYEHMSAPKVKDYGLNAVFANITYQKDNFYLFGGLGIHDEGSGCPEVCFKSNILGRFGFGLRFKL